MTVQDFIVIYNQTFIYLHEKHGKSAVVEFWKAMAREFCPKLERLVDEKGLKGMYEFFYGEEGTATREHVDGERYCTDDEYYERVDNCTSVRELMDRNKKVYRHYCEHCYWLYAHAVEKHGFAYDVEYELQKEGMEVPRCCVRAFRNA